MTDDLTGLVAVVTGGASGIGAATVRRLRDAGAVVAVLDRRIDAIVDGFGVDLSDARGVDSAIAAVADRFGGIDILVNNAGIGAEGAIDANSDDEWHKVWDVNVVGLVRTTRACLPFLRRSAAPAIVNVTSVVATIGLPQRALYSASKGAVLSLTRSLAVDLLADGIRVNAIAPGTTDTPWVERLTSGADDAEAARRALESRQPHGRLVAPEEIADAIAFLIDPRSRSTNGHVLVVDGGLTAIKAPGRSPVGGRACERMNETR